MEFIFELLFVVFETASPFNLPGKLIHLTGLELLVDKPGLRGRQPLTKALHDSSALVKAYDMQYVQLHNDTFC